VAGAEDVVISRNVIAVLAGSDAALRSEAVVVGAHMDHLGRVGGIVHPGADDNASGTAAVLQMASALAAVPQRPKRTIVFAFWTGEEEGHLGSDYYVHHPAWPLPHTTLYANLDMIAHPWLPEEIKKLVADVRLPGSEAFLARVKPADFIEPGVAAWAPELCPVLAQAARGLGLSLHFDRTDGKHGGSDYRAFARKDLRFIRFFGNYFPGYHEPTDTIEGVDPVQVRKIAALALATVWLVADR
jgi:Zn-dependent M28 family amino/carboxypeptidase